MAAASLLVLLAAVCLVPAADGFTGPLLRPLNLPWTHSQQSSCPGLCREILGGAGGRVGVALEAAAAGRGGGRIRSGGQRHIAPRGAVMAEDSKTKTVTRVKSPVSGRLIVVGGPAYQKMLKEGYVLTNNKLVHKDAVDEVMDADAEPTPPPVVEPLYEYPPAAPVDGLPVGSGFRVIYMDAQIVVVEKASGLLSVPGVSPSAQDCLLSRVGHHVPGVRIVHRLDRDTSGVMVLARDAESHRILSVAFERREVGKEYLAVGEGWCDEEALQGKEGVRCPGAGTGGAAAAASWGQIDLPIGKDLQRKGVAVASMRKMRVDFEGRLSRTMWRVLGRLDNPPGERTIFHLKPHTGRTHQLRVHLAMGLGHPIVGDEIYAPPAVADKSRNMRGIGRANRLCLHAWRLSFNHPETGSKVAFESAAPFAPDAG